MENITRISDLPLDNNMQMSNTYSSNMMQQQQQPKKVSFNDGEAQNYMPINVHPNPYGISAQNPIMPPPQQPNVSQKQQLLPQTYIPPPPQTQFLSEEQQMNIQLQELQQLSHQRVPSRDISNDTTMYQQDVQIKPNYIPKSNMSSDYVRDYEELTEKNYKEYEKKKKDKNRLDNIMTEFQIPIFVAILFFSFQLPIINKLIFKKISFLTLYDADGNFNMYGLILKSVLFGGIYYSVFKIINFLVEL
jgi:Fe2+ transport system protein B